MTATVTASDSDSDSYSDSDSDSDSGSDSDSDSDSENHWIAARPTRTCPQMGAVDFASVVLYFQTLYQSVF